MVTNAQNKERKLFLANCLFYIFSYLSQNLLLSLSKHTFTALSIIQHCYARISYVWRLLKSDGITKQPENSIITSFTNQGNQGLNRKVRIIATHRQHLLCSIHSSILYSLHLLTQSSSSKLIWISNKLYEVIIIIIIPILEMMKLGLKKSNFPKVRQQANAEQIVEAR